MTNELHFFFKAISVIPDTGLVFLEAQEAHFDWTYMVTLPISEHWALTRRIGGEFVDSMTFFVS